MENFKILLTICVFAYFVSASVSALLEAKPTEWSKLISAVTREPLSEGIEIKDTPLLEEEVRVLDRFYRTYEDGTIEYKIVLSNGLAEYKKISNKVVNGETIQVYEGYHSERLPDNTYRTTYYIADENGYRRLRREFDTKPPVLPPLVSYVPKVPRRFEEA